MRLPFSAAIDDTVGGFVWCVWAMHLLETCFGLLECGFPYTTLQV